MPSSATATKTAVPYDFRRPNKFNREHVRALQIVGETFARQLSTALSTTVRSISTVSLLGVSQLTYDEFLRDLPNPAYLAVLSLEPLAGHSLFHVPLPIIMTSIDRLLGGPGTGSVPNRGLTDIEAALSRSLMNRCMRELKYAFESLTAIEPLITSQESNPQFAQVAAASDTVVLITFEMKVSGVSGEAVLCIPFASLQPVLEEMTGNAARSNRSDADPTQVHRALALGLDTAPVTVTVRFNELSLLSSEILDLQPGDVLGLPHRADEPLTVAVGGVPQFTAKAGRRGRRLAAVVVDVVEKEHHL